MLSELRGLNLVTFWPVYKFQDGINQLVCYWEVDKLLMQ